MIGSIIDAVTGKTVLTLDGEGRWGGELRLFAELAARQPEDWRIPEGDPVGLLEAAARSIRSMLGRVVQVVPSPETKARLREAQVRVEVIH